MCCFTEQNLEPLLVLRFPVKQFSMGIFLFVIIMTYFQWESSFSRLSICFNITLRCKCTEWAHGRDFCAYVGKRQLRMRVTSVEILPLELIRVWYHVWGLYLGFWNNESRCGSCWIIFMRQINDTDPFPKPRNTLRLFITDAVLKKVQSSYTVLQKT